MTATWTPAAADLRSLLRRGLPVAGDAISDRLLGLAGVGARATAADRESRVAAFNVVMRLVLARFADRRLAEAARLLFGDVPACAGQTLTARRAVAARACGRGPDHFRKHLEPRILASLAQELAADSDRLATTRATPPRLMPVPDQPGPIPADMFAWEVIEHEEHLARLWAGVYALRAELLACERLASMAPSGAELRVCAEAALWRAGHLHSAVRLYRRAYGARMLHGGIAPDALVNLAGWSPPLDTGEIETVTRLTSGTAGPHDFITALTSTPAGAAILTRWTTTVAQPIIGSIT